ncbi:simple sugar transport system permease protein [Mumia flava]|uniref:Simple sugar transport system permease protein n=1 Tax=Mumia flava TaxID=1348852 RepID=A0A0B2BI95_9ACTN|nr:ABC transporter permease [Mumia flava]PJJ58472.1 simple sugar transport system permease protein [Mumia flava]
MTTTAPEPTQSPDGRIARLGRGYLWLLVTVGFLAIVSTVRVFSGAGQLNSVGTLQAALIATCPILLAALGGLWSERSGVVNIGLEGGMILGTWGAAYFTYFYGPWVGLIGAALMGALGGILHAIATVTFGVDHIVSGVAINIIAAGAVSFLAEAYFRDLQGGGIKQLTGLDTPPRIEIPWLGEAASDLAGQGWFFVSDLSAVVGALTNGLSIMVYLVAGLVVLTWWVLWHTAFGLRLRSCGENPQAAETLGVNVYRYKYIGVVMSGVFAGLGGYMLVLVSSSGFVTGQTGGRGYIGLAAMIFGNWRPFGAAGAATMFGYTDAMQLRSNDAVHALLLLVAVLLFVFAILRLRQGDRLNTSLYAIIGVAFLVWFFNSDSVPREFAGMTPYVATLLVLALGTQRLRMPAADGKPYKKGQAG